MMNKATSAIIPEPRQLKYEKGRFVFDSSVGLLLDSAWEEQRCMVLDLIADLTGERMVSIGRDDSEYNKKFILTFSPELKSEEYKLNVTEANVEIKASSPAGLFYALQSVAWLVRSDSMRRNLPCVSISDEPRFKWRGCMIDVGRHLFSVDDIKRFLEVMASLKLNVFHWHLTEDQGWRIEIDKYPKLTRVGAYRKETIIGRNSDIPRKFDGKPYGGFYTKNEVRDIVDYAESLHITVVPEIDMPGHCCAAIAAYPELGWKDSPAEVKRVWGVYEEGVLNLREETFEFVFDVLSEVIELFPGDFIHIGGDEAPKAKWEADPLAQKMIEEHDLNDENGLQSYFIRRVEKFLNENGKRLIGWDEILEGGIAPNAAVMSWRNENGAVEAANSGHDAVVATSQYLYFNMYQAPEETEPFGHGGDTPLYKVYSYEPIPEKVDASRRDHIIGVEACLWTEFIKTFDYLCYMAFPRIFALSETAWSAPEKKNWHRFLEKLPSVLELLNSKNINYRQIDKWTTAEITTTRKQPLGA